MVDHPNPFEEALNSHLEQQRQTEHTLRENSLEAVKQKFLVKGLIAAKEQRDRDHQGTLPDVVLGEEAGILCRQFLEFVATRGYPGCTKLIEKRDIRRVFFSNKPEWESIWEIRGYAIGHVSSEDTEDVRHSSKRNNVYLCEDGKLRFSDANAYTESAFEPQDLPLDRNGVVVTPRIGYFYQRYYESDNEGYASTYQSGYVNVFQDQTLADRLKDIVLNNTPTRTDP